MHSISEYQMLIEVMQSMSIKTILHKLSIHLGTFRRWHEQKKVPSNYYADLNLLLNNKYPHKQQYRDKDQFFTTAEISKYCYQKTLLVLENLNIDHSDYIFIEPSAGCGNFFSILPQNRRIGIDIEPQGSESHQLIKQNYLQFQPAKQQKYIVIGNPPFGLRGNLALRFINHSVDFADVVAFILPPLFDSTGKGVPMKRIDGRYHLAHSEKLPLDSFIYPNGTKINIATIFQVWSKINTDKIPRQQVASCKSFIKIYSLSDGGTPSSTRNKKMLNCCDAYLPSTCFSGMKAYNSFANLPNQRGYGIVFLQKQQQLKEMFFHKINWQQEAFLSTNSAINLRSDIIEKAIIKYGYYDK